MATIVCSRAGWALYEWYVMLQRVLLEFASRLALMLIASNFWLVK